MDRVLKIGACLMTALLATGAAAATVDIAADGTFDLVTDHGHSNGAGGANVHVDDEGASANAAGGAATENEHGSASGSAGGSASADKPETPDVPETDGSAGALGDLDVGL